MKAAALFPAAALFAALTLTGRLDAQRPAAPQNPAARPAAPGPAAARPSAARPAAARPVPQPAEAVPDTAVKIDYRREVFSYQGGSRDPFASLVTSSDVRPTIADLRVVSIVYDPRGNSVAIVREANNPRPHRVRRGDQLGRLRVVAIRQYEVVFQVEEFGFERQETLTLSRPEANR